MSNFAIIADAASGMTKDLRERFKIEDYIPGKITYPDGSDHESDMDWSLMSPDEYYQSMIKDKAIYNTGVPSLEIVEEKIEKFFKQGRDVLLITLSSGMSGTYNTCLNAGRIAEEKYPGRKAAIVDSLRFSAHVILMNIKASRMRDEGKSLEETAKWISENNICFRQAGPMNDLKFLARKGRITGLKAFFGQLAGVNALGEFSRRGVTEVLVNIKGTQKALKAAVEYISETIVDPEERTVLISHSYRAEEAETLKKLIREKIHPREIIMVRTDMQCGANIGPGMAAAYYYGKEVTEDLSWEKELFARIAESLK